MATYWENYGHSIINTSKGPCFIIQPCGWCRRLSTEHIQKHWLRLKMGTSFFMFPFRESLTQFIKCLQYFIFPAIPEDGVAETNNQPQIVTNKSPRFKHHIYRETIRNQHPVLRIEFTANRVCTGQSSDSERAHDQWQCAVVTPQVNLSFPFVSCVTFASQNVFRLVDNMLSSSLHC